ncbi:SusC/RagA family TonB-linked outer membrane protein [Algoriphagus antarcticus]|uniref:TonB-linked SusC/RagA family outer membrane protein n=1 Tax=Algoriphagus antarcticus TaxID=238540 RepID=A0A3E0D4U0_9BACT|nr:SusC/RagA family TonB-linked outer membrane protein [Algoriphagus antarcticus]REG77513.1 TonB-linked SusC/RagA family outer membrane protein [Algoriphagus antarcticus]
MKKTIPILIALLFSGWTWAQQTTSYTLIGTVAHKADTSPLPGVNVLLKGSSIGTVTDLNGEFELDLSSGEHLLTFSFIGYLSQELLVTIPASGELVVLLEEDTQTLAEVTVVSTGFQELPLERTTGSFVHVDQKLLNRKVSTNILDRLEDVTPGLIFNRDRTDLQPGESISIRGNSTLLANLNPLVVVDNMIYDGPVESLNPNDVESITVLRDAAAASIWGARAGNGVIVIKTKRSDFYRPLQVSVNSNVTVGQSFNSYYQPQMGISEFVDVERRLYDQGYYRYRYDSYDNQDVSPVIETLYAAKSGDISSAELESRLLQYRSADVRQDLQRYFYRPSINQQYAVSLSGGSKAYSYLVSMGYDDNRETQVGQDRNRLTLNTRQQWGFWKEKVELELGTYLISNKESNGSPDLGSLHPYDFLHDQSGNSLPVIRDYNPRFKADALGQGALDWDYYPIDEIGLSPHMGKDIEARINIRASFSIVDGIRLESNYQFWQRSGSQQQVNGQDSYFSRNLVNLYSTLLEGTTPVYGIPVGGIMDLTEYRGFSHTWRTQLNFNKKIGEIHELNGLAGFEMRDLQNNSSQNRFYGFNHETGISQAVDYVSFFPQLNTGWGYQVPFGQSTSGSINRFTSLFANIGYTYKDKILVTGSARSDASNLFGVSTNQRRVPLWSAGLGWILSEEKWIGASWVDFLKLKASYGFNGNTNPSATAFTTGRLFGSNTNPWVGEPWMSLLNPPNPQLRWEKIKIINMGLEWELLRGRISGTLEGYRKEGKDLYGIQPYFPSSGNHTVTRNYANTMTHGFDINISGKIIEGKFNWITTWFHSMVKEKVTHYNNVPNPQNVASYSSGRSGLLPEPMEGEPLYSIVSYPFEGLNPDDGSPMGLLNGEPSTDYAAILNQTKLEDLEFHGSAIPTNFGAWRNQLAWKGWEFSVNLSYRMGYYFRRETVNYTTLNRGNITHADYERRWKNPGDELITRIPSDPLNVNETRTTFELVNSSQVRKGDHIRLQDIQVAYTFQKTSDSNLPFESLRIYGYANNLGILWKSAKDVVDPDFRNIQSLNTYSIGLNIQF